MTMWGVEFLMAKSGTIWNPSGNESKQKESKYGNVGTTGFTRQM